MTDRRIAQRFAVQATLEESKLGTLYAVRDEVLEAPALLLVAAASAQTSPDVLEAIVGDNRKLAASPDILLTYAAGRGDDGVWLASEAGGPGVPLDELLKRRDRLEMPQLMRLALALGRGLDAQARAGVHHFDLGPHRVWVPGGSLERGAVRVFGLGWHRLLPAWHQGAAADGFYGNPEFLAAELCKGQPADAPADVYSAALVLWAMAAQKPPFTSSQPLMTLKRQAVEKPLRLDLVKPALKGVKELQALVAEALDKDPARRPGASLWLSAIEALTQQWAPEALLEEPVLPPTRARVVAGDVATTQPLPTVAAPAAPPAAALPERVVLPEPTAAPASPVAQSEPAAEPVATPVPLAEPAPTAAAPAPAPSAAPPGAAEPATAAGWQAEAGDRGAVNATMKMPSAAVTEALARAEDSRAEAGRAGTQAAGDDQPTRVMSVLPEDEGEDDETPEAGAAPTGYDRGRQGKKGKKGKRDRQTLTPAPVTAKAEPKPAEAKAAEPVKAPEAKPTLPAAPTAPAAAEPARIVVKTGPGAAPAGKKPLTERTMRVEIAESVFFDDEAAAPRDLHEQVPPTPTAGKVSKAVMFGILGFVLAMAGLATWMVMGTPPEPPPAPPAAEEPGTAEQVAAEPEPAPEPVPPVEPVAAPAPEPVPVAEAAEPGDALAAAAPDTAVAEPTAAPDQPAAVEPAPVADTRAAELNRLVEEGTALLGKDARGALAKAEAALAINAGHAPAARLKAEAQNDLERQEAQARAAAEQAAKDAAAKAAADELAAEQAAKAAAAGKAAADKAAKDQAARAAADKTAADRAAKAAADKAAKEQAARAAAEKAAADRAAKAAADKAAREQAARAAAEKAAAAKAAKATRPAPADKAAADKAAKDQAATSRPKPAEVAARPPAAAGDESSPAQQEASKMAALAQKANKAKLKVLYLQKAVKLDPGNSTYRNLLKIAESELASESQQQ